ncbi:hypothetical protein BGW42_003892 [Actinomortierella wolfii]|nr:hypothetical protein BGW42_003892 [Actinomortierella wolfii]
MFEQAVAFLYNNPFAAAASELNWSKRELVSKRHAALLTTFLLEADPQVVSELPPWSLKQRRRQQPVHGAFGHPAEVARMKRTMRLGTLDDKKRALLLSSLGERIDDDEEEADDHNDGNEDEDKALERRRRFYHHYFRHFRYQNVNIIPVEALMRVFPTITNEEIPHLRRRLTRAFMMHNPSNVLSLSLNAPDMASMDIRAVIPSLSSLRFIQIDQLTALQESEIGSVVDWITHHNELHGSIKHLTLGGYYDEDKYSDGNRTYLVKIVQAFPSLLTLVMTQWSEAWRNIGEIPLTTLRRLVMDHGGGCPRPEDADFLSRCERLEILDLYVAEVDPFDKLAQRYLAHHRWAHDNQTNSEGNTHSRSLIKAVPLPGIPPIRKLYISGEGTDSHLRNAFDNAPVALSQTLRVLKVSSLDRFPVDRPSLTWGGGVSIGLQLPFLQELQLQGDIALEFPFHLLGCCPNLASLRIVVSGLESCARAGNDLDPILTLSKLQVLQLIGQWPVTAVWLEKLATCATGLKILDLEGCTTIELQDVLERVGRMPHLRRLGWDVIPPELVVKWHALNPALLIEKIPLRAYYQ